jgi:hypothetical protein
MTSTGWSFVEAAARLLARDEREAVLGDLAEADESAWQGLKLHHGGRTRFYLRTGNYQE